MDNQPPQNNQNQQPNLNQPFVSGFSSDEQAPPPPTQPAANMPPVPQSGTQPEQPTPAPEAVPAQTKPRKKSGRIKKILLVFLFLLILAAAGFVVWKLVLPRLSGIGGVGNKEVSLTWWGLWEDEEIVKPIIEKYQADNPGVTIHYLSQAKADYRERLQNALARGEGPDIFRFHNSWVPMFNTELDRLPSSVMTAQEFSQTFYPSAAADLSTADGIVGVPLMYDGLGLFINEDIFATYGKVAPTTWDELRSLARELTIKGENNQIQQAGVALGLTANVDHWQEIVALMALQNGGKLSSPGDLVLGAVEYYKQFAGSLGVWDSSLPPSTIMFASGKLAMYFAPSWRALEIMDMNPSLNFKVVAVPQLPKDNKSEPDIAYASYWAEGVWQGSKQKLEAWKFLKYLSQKETLENLYMQASGVRRFGEPYSRVDMRDLLLADPILGGIVISAPQAKSWFLYSRTFDGDTGLNSRLSDYYEDLINSERPESTIQSTASGVTQVLSQYGLVKAPAPASQ